LRGAPPRSENRCRARDPYGTISQSLTVSPPSAGSFSCPSGQGGPCIGQLLPTSRSMTQPTVSLRRSPAPSPPVVFCPTSAALAESATRRNNEDRSESNHLEPRAGALVCPGSGSIPARAAGPAGDPKGSSGRGGSPAVPLSKSSPGSAANPTQAVIARRGCRCCVDHQTPGGLTGQRALSLTLPGWLALAAGTGWSGRRSAGLHISLCERGSPRLEQAAPASMRQPSEGRTAYCPSHAGPGMPASQAAQSMCGSSETDAAGRL
jgi:hypothetical protein